MPCSWPLSSTNCSGGRVGLIDMTSVPALMMLGGAILGWARAAPGAMARTRRSDAGLQQATAANVVVSMDDLFMLIPHESAPVGCDSGCNFDAEAELVPD